MRRESVIWLVAGLAWLGVALAPGQVPGDASVERRLERIEERLDALERNAETQHAAGDTVSVSQGLLPESEAKLDRLEVRLIQLETQSPECDCATAQQGLFNRVRSLERQLARLRTVLNR